MRAGHSRGGGNLVAFACLLFQSQAPGKALDPRLCGVTVSRCGARHPQGTAQLAYHSAPLSHACWSFPRWRESSFFRVLVCQSEAPRKALDPRLCGGDGEPSRSAPSARDRAVGVSLRDAVARMLVIPAVAGIQFLSCACCFRAERQEKRWIPAFVGMTVSRRGARHPQATAQLAYHSAMLSHACWSFPRTRESSFFRVLVVSERSAKKSAGSPPSQG